MTIRRIKKGAAACPPTFEEEQRLYKEGYRFVAGIDEVGRGAVAGPVAAAAVILPADSCQLSATNPFCWLSQVRDSKQLSPRRREELSPWIQKIAISCGVGMVSPEDVDAFGIMEATREAMYLAVEQLLVHPDFLLIDFISLPEILIPQRGLVHGDQISLSIACASILAKVTRDHYMKEMGKVYPGYGMASHKGYATTEHCLSLRQLGPCPIHRRSFEPVKGII